MVDFILNYTEIVQFTRKLYQSTPQELICQRFISLYKQDFINKKIIKTSMLAKTKYFTESKKSRDEMQAIKPYFRK